VSAFFDIARHPTVRSTTRPSSESKGPSQNSKTPQAHIPSEISQSAASTRPRRGLRTAKIEATATPRIQKFGRIFNETVLNHHFGNFAVRQRQSLAKRKQGPRLQFERASLATNEKRTKDIASSPKVAGSNLTAVQLIVNLRASKVSEPSAVKVAEAMFRPPLDSFKPKRS
jgi:hypothetical protein